LRHNVDDDSIFSLCKCQRTKYLGATIACNVWTQAHDERGILNMTVDSSTDQLVTAGAGL